MRKNTASQIVAFQMVSTTDGSDVTSGTPTVYVTINGGTQGTGSGTSAHEGNGQWTYAPTQADTNGDHVVLTMVLSGAVSQAVNVYPVSFDPTDSVRAGLTALPNAAAGASGGLPTGDGNARVDVGSWLGTAVTTSSTTALPEVDAKSISDNAAAADNVQANIGNLDAAISGLNDPTAAAIADAVWDELATGHTDAGKAGQQLWTDIDAVLVDTAEIGAAGAGLTALATAASIAALNDVAATDIVSSGAITTSGGAVSTVTTLTGHTAQTGDSFARLGAPAGASVSADIAAAKSDTAAILVDTGTTLPATLAALNDISVADVLTTQMTESYSADGAAPTVAQALMMIQQMLGEFAISGTTLTVKRVDGSTTAATFTLDDASTPTSLTRAT